MRYFTGESNKETGYVTTETLRKCLNFTAETQRKGNPVPALLLLRITPDSCIFTIRYPLSTDTVALLYVSTEHRRTLTHHEKKTPEVTVKKIICLVAVCMLIPGVLIAQQSPRLESPVPLPILAWLGPPAEQTNYGRYKELADAGFTHSFSNFPDPDAMAKALDIAKAAGIKLLINIPELKTDPEGTVKRFKDHPGTAGYYLRDEPNAKDFRELADWVKRIRAVDDKHFCYINLFPNYATAEQLGNSSYREHIRAFIETVPVKVLSFDHYPVMANGIRPEWYENLVIISDAARNARKPFWAFALAVAHDPYPVPSIPHLKLQVYSNLAYGAQGIEYFTYWTPKSTTWNFHEGPIESDGRRTSVYERVKLVNSELRTLSGIFVGAKVLSVGHVGPDMPRGVKPYKLLPPFSEIATGDGNAIISWLENGSKKYLVIVNSSVQYTMMLGIMVGGSTQVNRIQKTGDILAVPGSLNMVVSPGDVAIFSWE